ncbi:MAG: hypothetical protein RJQ00_07055 [Vicingaceae bacterium]
MKRLNQLLSIGLLLVLGLAIVPAESFHHHHEETILCKEGQIHLEVKQFECELCNFVLPTLIQGAEQQSNILIGSSYSYQVKNTPTGVSTFFDIPKYRGPPEIV